MLKTERWFIKKKWSYHNRASKVATATYFKHESMLWMIHQFTTTVSLHMRHRSNFPRCTESVTYGKYSENSRISTIHPMQTSRHIINQLSTDTVNLRPLSFWGPRNVDSRSDFTWTNTFISSFDLSATKTTHSYNRITWLLCWVINVRFFFLLAKRSKKTESGGIATPREGAPSFQNQIWNQKIQALGNFWSTNTACCWCGRSCRSLIESAVRWAWQNSQ